MSRVLEDYRELQKKLSWIRWKHSGHDSEEEDSHLEFMDEIWWKLSAEERETIASEPSRQDPIEPNMADPQIVDVDVQSFPGPVRTKAA